MLMASEVELSFLGRDRAHSSAGGLSGRGGCPTMLTIDRRDDVTVVRLENPPVNALDLELLRALTAALGESAGPLVLTGAGRSFSAGVDLRRIVEGDEGY